MYIAYQSCSLGCVPVASAAFIVEFVDQIAAKRPPEVVPGILKW